MYLPVQYQPDGTVLIHGIPVTTSTPCDSHLMEYLAPQTCHPSHPSDPSHPLHPPQQPFDTPSAPLPTTPLPTVPLPTWKQYPISDHLNTIKQVYQRYIPIVATHVPHHFLWLADPSTKADMDGIVKAIAENKPPSTWSQWLATYWLLHASVLYAIWDHSDVNVSSWERDTDPWKRCCYKCNMSNTMWDAFVAVEYPTIHSWLTTFHTTIHDYRVLDMDKVAKLQKDVFSLCCTHAKLCEAAFSFYLDVITVVPQTQLTWWLTWDLFHQKDPADVRTDANQIPVEDRPNKDLYNTLETKYCIMFQTALTIAKPVIWTSVETDVPKSAETDLSKSAEMMIEENSESFFRNAFLSWERGVLVMYGREDTKSVGVYLRSNRYKLEYDEINDTNIFSVWELPMFGWYMIKRINVTLLYSETKTDTYTKETTLDQIFQISEKDEKDSMEKDSVEKDSLEKPSRTIFQPYDLSVLLYPDSSQTNWLPVPRSDILLKGCVLHFKTSIDKFEKPAFSIYTHKDYTSPRKKRWWRWF